MKSGFVAVIGRPNAGKSTLINNIIGKKIAITSNKPQTTRNIIHGIYNEEDTQIIFVDTPGIHKPKHKLGRELNKMSYFSMEDVDLILFVVDVKEGLGSGDHFIIEKLKTQDKPVILILNKIDQIPKQDLLKHIVEYKDLYPFSEIIPVSALKEDHHHLINIFKKYLKEDIKYYDEKDITNVSTSFLISEFVREKVLNLTEEEVPHSVTCMVEHIEHLKNVVHINVAIIVDRDNLKHIIIGKQGSKIKEIGMQARKDIENLLDKKVFLELYVKTLKNWRDREKYLIELGFNIE